MDPHVRRYLMDGDILPLSWADVRRGLAREMAEAMVARARDLGVDTIGASVDGVNVGSTRILEGLGFLLAEARAGAFGELRIYRLGLV